MFENLFEKDKRSTIVYAREKKVDKDFFYNIDSRHRPENGKFQFRSDNCRSFFYAPNVANFGFKRKVPKIAL